MRLLATAFASAVNWQEWLLLADRLNMTRIVVLCVQPVVKNLLSSYTSAMQVVATLSPLSERTFQLIAEALTRMGLALASSRAPDFVPATTAWNVPGDLL